MSRKSVIASVLLCSILVSSLSGCATIMSERKYEVTMDNSGGPTYFTVHNHKNRVVHSGLTPKQVTLPAKTKWLLPAKYQVTYAGHGSVQQEQLKARLDLWTAGNLILGGGLGIFVDAATGAMWKLEDRVMGQVPAHSVVSNESEGGAVLASYNRIAPQQDVVDGQHAPDVRQASFGSPQQQQPKQ